MHDYDVLLINPPSRSLNEDFEHLGLAYIAAFLRQKKINVKIINMPWKQPVSTALDIVKKYNAKIIGISIPFQDGADLSFEFITALRKSGCDAYIVLGGIYPTFSYEEILTKFSVIDSIVLGEGEETFTELAESILQERDWKTVKSMAYREKDKIIVNELRPLVKDLDSMPFPARDTLPDILNKANYAVMMTSRGCYGRCTFCSVVAFFSKFGPKYRWRSSESVLEEISILYNQYGVRNISFNDATFIGGKGRGYQRAYQIADEIIKRKMDINFYIQCRVDDVDKELFEHLKKAGLNKVFLGVESGSQSMLDRFQKDTTIEENIEALKILGELDIYVSMGFITFDDAINFTELSDNLLFLQQARKIMPKNKLVFYSLGKVLPLAGTQVEKVMKEKNKYKGNSLNFKYSFDNPRIGILFNTTKAIADVFWKIKRGFNMTTDFDQVWLKREKGKNL